MAEALIIEPGEDREIEARVHRFSEIHVKSYTVGALKMGRPLFFAPGAMLMIGPN